MSLPNANHDVLPSSQSSGTFHKSAEENPARHGSGLGSKLLGQAPVQQLRQRGRVTAVEVCSTRLFVAQGLEGQVAVWDLDTDTLLEFLKPHDCAITSLIMHDARLYCAAVDKTISCSDGLLPTSRAVRITGTNVVRRLAPGPDLVFALYESSNVVLGYKTGTLQRKVAFHHTFPVSAFGMCSRGVLTCPASWANIFLWDTAGRKLSSFPTLPGVDRLYYHGGAVHCVHAKGGASVNRSLITRFSREGCTATCYYPPTGFLASGYEDGTLVLESGQGGKESTQIHEKAVTSIQLSGAKLYTGSSDKRVLSWDVHNHVGDVTPEDTDAVLKVVPEHPKMACCLVL